jgi:hypothetical protein
VQALRRKLQARKIFVPWGGKPFERMSIKLMGQQDEQPGTPEAMAAAEMVRRWREPGGYGETPGSCLGTCSTCPDCCLALQVELPPDIEPLVLWQPPAGVEGQPVQVDDMLVQFLVRLRTPADGPRCRPAAVAGPQRLG